jgi:NAD(P)-dependent dehydrogenase (short-subunit alcohol dehydrogenase family)
MTEERTNVAVVTGAAAGLGRSYARRLADDGFDLVLVDLDSCDATEADVAAAGAESMSALVDVTDPDAVTRLAAAVEERFRGCDVLVNNAGIYPLTSLDELTFEEYRRVMATNADSVFLTGKAFVPGMRERRFGRIINIATQVNWMALPGVVAYVASKMAVIGLTRTMATELGADDITVNCISPGLVRTDTNVATHDPGVWETVRTMSQVIPRTIMPDDVAGLVSFLASDDASLITGQNFLVNAGAVRL